MNNSKSLHKILLVCALSVSAAAFGQSAIQRTETTPGNYDNVRSTNAGTATFLASAARTATQTQADQTLNLSRGILVYCNVTVAPGVETLTLSVQGKDPLSLAYYTIATNLAQVATGLIILKVHPNLTTVASAVTGATANDYLPTTWRILMTHSGGGSWTYSCAYQLIN